jgi:perosamine synthetase
MYRLPEVAAAMGLGQLEKLDWFVELRKRMASKYLQVIKDLKCDWLVPQKTPHGDVNSYYTFAAKFEHPDVPWVDFRKKFTQNGGDGFYAAWALCYLEDSIPEVQALLDRMHLGGRFQTEKGLCPNAEIVQQQMMQMTTNQKDEEEMNRQADCLYNTIKYFS